MVNSIMERFWYNGSKTSIFAKNMPLKNKCSQNL